MARKKNDWRSYARIYNAVCDKYHISRTLSVKEISDMFILIGDNIQGQICESSDYIKIDGLENASNILGRKLQKKDWLNMVQLGVKTVKTNSNVDKIESNINATISDNSFINDFNNSFKSNLKSGNISSIIVPEDTSYTGKISGREIPEFTTLYNECVETRNTINKILWKELNTIGRAFEYLYKGKLTAADYKLLVDDIHYEDGGYPSKNTPARTWSKISSFDKLYNALCVSGNEQYINDYLAMFGLKVERIPEGSTYKEWNKKHPNRRQMTYPENI